METYTIQNLSFRYPEASRPAVSGINTSIRRGEFVTLCGPSGSGKSTLLRLLKPALAPHGEARGKILFQDGALSELTQREQASKIGFVRQDPENQIVCDKVWHELAFGLENLGVPTPEIRRRVAEMASFFGVQAWFHKPVSELSGGQKQLLNLASVMVMQPEVLLLDEPTSQLDPIAAADFLETVQKINRELGTTILISEHRLEELLAMSDRVLVLENGMITVDACPQEAGQRLREENSRMFLAMPAPMRVYAGVPSSLPCPVSVREGREWMGGIAKERMFVPVPMPEEPDTAPDPAIELKEVFFRYTKEGEEILKGTNLRVNQGEFMAVVGGNGTGKTTMLSIVSGLLKPQRGAVLIGGRDLKTIPDRQLFGGVLGVLPQNPQAMFVKKTVKEDLLDALEGMGFRPEELESRVAGIARTCHLEDVLDRHPYDLSGGEQQRAALAKVLLREPKILLMDEPTKGMDSFLKQEFAEVLEGLLDCGVTILMVSHDIEFCASHAQRCAMFFDGGVVSMDTPRRFFAGNSFYTTAVNRMARDYLPTAVTVEELITACGGTGMFPPGREQNIEPPRQTELWTPQERESMAKPKDKRHLPKRTILALVLILLAVPLTIFAGVYYLGDRKYTFISLLVILEALIPFFVLFEKRKPQARELIVIAVLCVIGVAGRAVFFMLPQFKAMTAVVIIAGVCFGGESGFLVGAVTAFASNMFFGQGPWTPWQMAALGLIGFLAGVLFQKGWLRPKRLSLAVFGAAAALVLYGGIMNPASVLMFQPHPAKEMFYLAYLQGLPFDLIHAGATALFLFLISDLMIEKLERVKIKYGLLAPEEG